MGRGGVCVGGGGGGGVGRGGGVAFSKKDMSLKKIGPLLRRVIPSTEAIGKSQNIAPYKK